MKAKINRLLKPLGLSVHGTGYIRKLQASIQNKDAFQAQKVRIKTDCPVIFDVGANSGSVSLKYLSVFPNATINAFEPFKQFHETFRKNLIGKSTVHLKGVALSNKMGVVDFYVNESADTNSLLQPSLIGASSDKMCTNKEVIKVESTTLDAFCLKNEVARIDILKLDTQGSELFILEGAKKLLAEKAIKLIYTECYYKEQYLKQPLFYDIANFLKNYDYFLEDIYDPYYNNDFLLWSDAIFLPLKQK